MSSANSYPITPQPSPTSSPYTTPDQIQTPPAMISNLSGLINNGGSHFQQGLFHLIGAEGASALSFLTRLHQCYEQSKAEAARERERRAKYQREEDEFRQRLQEERDSALSELEEQRTKANENRDNLETERARGDRLDERLRTTEQQLNTERIETEEIREQLCKRDSQLADAESRASDSENVRNSTLNLLARNEKENNEIRTHLATKNHQIELLNKSITEERAKSDSYLAERVSLGDELTKEQSERRTIEAQLEAAEDRRAESDNNLRRAQKELFEERARNSDLQEELAEARTKAESVDTLHAENNELEAARQTQANQVTELLNDRRELEDLINRLREQQRAMNIQAEGLRKDTRIEHEINTELRARITNLEQECNQLEAARQTQANRTAELLNDCRELEDQIDRLQEQQRATTTQAEGLREDIRIEQEIKTELRARITNLERERNGLAVQLRQVCAHRDNLTNANAALRRAGTFMQWRVFSLRARCDTLAAERAKLRTTVDQTSNVRAKLHRRPAIIKYRDSRAQVATCERGPVTIHTACGLRNTRPSIWMW